VSSGRREFPLKIKVAQATEKRRINNQLTDKSRPFMLRYDGTVIRIAGLHVEPYKHLAGHQCLSCWEKLKTCHASEVKLTYKSELGPPSSAFLQYSTS
jgi:hypothetical protein